jgi:hypothetical protein
MVDRFVPNVPKESKLKMYIDEQTVAASEENKKVRSSLYASDYGQCQRKVWYQFFPKEYPEEKPSPRVLRIFANGNDVHTRLGSYLKRIPELDFHDEVNVPRDELDVHGRCDGICTVDGAALVVEFKSINAKDVYEPKDEHIGQLTWYMQMFRNLKMQLLEDFGFKEGDVGEADLQGVTALSGRTLDDLDHVERWLLLSQGEIRGEIIYESKQSNETHHFPLDYDSTRAHKVRLWFEQVHYFVQKKERPDVKYDKGKYPCQWGYGAAAGKCSFYKYCWG